MSAENIADDSNDADAKVAETATRRFYPKTHANYWKSRLEHRTYTHNGKTLEVELLHGRRPWRPTAHYCQVLRASFPCIHLARGGSSLRTRVAAYYEETRLRLLERITAGHLVHADETKARKTESQGYVWVFTNLHEVVYLYAASREAEVLSGVLKGFKGVLVSDFYAAYDSIDCPQQKCLIHIMRDLNNDVLANPYDEELKKLVRDFASLLKPMIDTIDCHGLKRHFLNKHLKAVKLFYKQLSTNRYSSEPALGYKQRFEKNRDKLFTFLKYDGVPWNNNNAEHAIKAYTRRFRAISSGASTPKAMSESLILLTMCETCRFMGVDFLDFLRSGEKDIHAFAESRRRRRKLSVNSESAASVSGTPSSESQPF